MGNSETISPFFAISSARLPVLGRVNLIDPASEHRDGEPLGFKHGLMAAVSIPRAMPLKWSARRWPDRGPFESRQRSRKRSDAWFRRWQASEIVIARCGRVRTVPAEDRKSRAGRAGKAASGWESSSAPDSVILLALIGGVFKSASTGDAPGDGRGEAGCPKFGSRGSEDSLWRLRKDLDQLTGFARPKPRRHAKRKPMHDLVVG